MYTKLVSELKKEKTLCWNYAVNDQHIRVMSSNRSYVEDIEIPSSLVTQIISLGDHPHTLSFSVNQENTTHELMLVGKYTHQIFEGYLALKEDPVPIMDKVIDHNLFTESILAEVNSLLIVIDKEGTILKVNKTFEDLCGKKEKELIGKNAQRLFMRKEEAEKSLKRIASLYKENEKIEVIRPVVIGNKEYQIFWKNILIKDPTSEKQFIICAGTDISKQLEANRRLEEISKQDALTGLWNRSAVKEKVQKYVLSKTPFNMVFLDFNEFKLVNDSYGHSVGDDLLIKFSKLLKYNDSFSYIARLGGDEFLILHEGSKSNLNDALEELFLTLESPLIEKPSIKVKFSAGIVAYPKDGASFEDLFRRADLAMYKAKKLERKVVEFEDFLEKDALKLGWLEENFEKALENDEFFIVLQPKFEVSSSKIIGAEALVRWKSTVKGEMVYPDEFIPFAEKYGYIQKLGERVLELSCIELKRLKEKGLAVPVSVNISAKQFESDLLLNKIFNMLSKYDVPASLLEIELTETAVSRNPKLLKQILKELRQAGIKVNLDDFGKGESSLFLLGDIELDTLKLDKSFIDKIQSPRGFALIKGITLAAKGLSLNVVAEGIETLAQRNLVENLGIETGQGYWFSRPLTPRDFEKMLEEAKPKTIRMSHP